MPFLIRVATLIDFSDILVPLCIFGLGWLQNLILIGFQNHRKNLPQRAHLEHFRLRRVGEYCAAPLRIRVATLIDFDVGPFLDQGRYPNRL